MKVVYQIFILLFFLSCTPINYQRSLTPQTKFEIACFDVSLKGGGVYDVFVLNFVANGDVWVFWAKDSEGKLGFNPVYRIDYGMQYYEPYTTRGGMLEKTAKDFVIELFLGVNKKVDTIQKRYY